MNSAILNHAPLAALLFFLVVFIVIAVRTYRPSAKQQLQEQAFIPLKEETNG